MQRLPSSLKPKYKVDPTDHESIKRQKKRSLQRLETTAKTMFERSLNPKNIVKDLQLAQSDYMDSTKNTAQPEPSSLLDLQPGVLLNDKGREVSGQKYHKKNRMSMDEYAILAQRRGIFL